MTHFINKLASGLTALALVASFVPAAAFAQEADVDAAANDENLSGIVVETPVEEAPVAEEVVAETPVVEQALASVEDRQVAAVTETEEVTPNASNGWVTTSNAQGTASYAYDDNAPMGDSALKLKTDADVNSVIRVRKSMSVALADMTEVSYETRQVSAADAVNGNATVRISIDLDGDAVEDDQLMFEPYYNGFSGGNDWNTFSITPTAGNLWSNYEESYNGKGGVGAGSYASNFTISDVLADHTDATVIGVVVSMGSYNVSQEVMVDNVVISSVDESTAYNFEFDDVTAQTVVVTADSSEGWVATGQETGSAIDFVTDENAPIGDSALQLTTSEDVNSVIRYKKLIDDELSNFFAISYSTKQATATDAVNGNATVRISIDLDGDAVEDDQLMFEPYYNGFSGGNDWNTWDITRTSGNLWSNYEVTYNGKGGVGAGSYASNFTISDVLASYPNAQVLGLVVSMGSYNVSQQVLVDAVTYTSATESTVYNFETPEETNNGGSGRSGGSRRTTTGTVAGASTDGQVLGASTYNFTMDLTIGSMGADVTALQAMLIASGDLMIAAPTGYFGELTRAALAKWQAAHGVMPAVGYFGPLTRAAVAAAMPPAPAMTDAERAAMIKDLLEKVKELQEKLAEMEEDAA